MTKQSIFPRCSKCEKVMVAIYRYCKPRGENGKWVKIGCACTDCKEMAWLE